MKTCEVCDGRRHVLDAGVWKRCGCLERERRAKLWRTARIPVRYDVETWRSFFARYAVADPGSVASMQPLRGVVEALARGTSEGCDVAAIGDPEGRDLLAALLLRAAVARSLSAELCDLRRLIDFEFGKPAEDAPGGAPREKGLVAVRLGDEPKNAWNKVALERLLVARRDAALGTILVCAADPHALGVIYASSEVGDAIAGRFRVVEVRRLASSQA